jgi:hypothetical protein
MHGTENLKYTKLIVPVTAMYLFLSSKRILFHGARATSGPRPSHYRDFTIILRHTTVGRTPLDKWSAPRTELYLTKHNTHNRQISMPPVGFEPAFPVIERPQTHVLDIAASNEKYYRCWEKQALYEFKYVFFRFIFFLPYVLHFWPIVCVFIFAMITGESYKR